MTKFNMYVLLVLEAFTERGNDIFDISNLVVADYLK